MNGTAVGGGGAVVGGAALECDTDVDVSAADKAFRFVVHGVLLNGVGGAGLVGNALAVAVLARPQMRCSINCLLAGLAAADSALILTSVLLFGLSAIYPYTSRLRYYYYHVCPRLTPYAYPLANAAQTMSVYLTLTVTLERWVAVCHPFRAKALCTGARARWYVAGTALFALAYNAPRFLEVAVDRVEAADGSDAIYCVRATEFRTDTYVLVYVHWLYLAVMYVVPFSALALLNALIVRQVRRAQAERARLSRSQRRELSLATMLLVVVLVFFLCNLLPLVTNAVEVFGGSAFDRLDPLVKTTNLLVTINSSVNFLIYVIFGEKFKRVFLKLFCGGRLRRMAGWRGGTAGGGGRDSPDHTRDDSCASAGGGVAHERVSLRTRNGSWRASRRAQAAPTVYYPRAPPPPATDVTCADLTPPPPRWNGHAPPSF